MPNGRGGSVASDGISEPRLAVFLDAPNFYRAVKESGASVSPADILDYARSLGRPAVAIAYLALKDGLPVDHLARTYSESGYSVKFVPPCYNTRDVDTTMVADIVQAAYEDFADTFVVVTGDADFVPALEAARRRGKHAVVLAFPSSCSEALRSRADAFVPLPIDAATSPEIPLVTA